VWTGGGCGKSYYYTNFRNELFQFILLKKTIYIVCFKTLRIIQFVELIYSYDILIRVQNFQ
jgi:hypothetical protein